MGPLSSSDFKVSPKPLEVHGGEVTATINGVFPEKYFNRKAIVNITPQWRAAQGTAEGQSATFQGEKVLGNNQSISYRLGGRYTLKSTFPYKEGMQDGALYATFKARIGKKTVEIPDVLIAQGLNTTSQLYKQALKGDGLVLAPDSFERIKSQRLDANVKFLINQANLRQSELKNNSVQEFVKLLKRINADKKNLNLKNVAVSAYASPEGGVSFNEKLAAKRQTNSESYVKQQLQQARMQQAPIDAHYTAQDWEGFRRLVAASNIQDKDVILRVLSMYTDPEQREQQIRNMSLGFRELADAILPELRRSRLTINYETIGRSDEEIKAQYAADATKLSPEELLYAATLETNPAKKETVYRKAAEYYDKDYRAFNNLAKLAYAQGNTAMAESYLQQAQRVNKKAGEALANQGLIALGKGQVDEAANLIAQSVGANGYGQALGTLEIARGNYAAAVKALAGTHTNAEALAYILTNKLNDAKNALNAVEAPNGLTSYLHAVASARMGNKFAAQSYLKEALEKDPSLKALAEHDPEFSLIRQ